MTSCQTRLASASLSSNTSGTCWGGGHLVWLCHRSKEGITLRAVLAVLLLLFVTRFVHAQYVPCSYCFYEDPETGEICCFSHDSTVTVSITEDWPDIDHQIPDGPDPGSECDLTSTSMGVPIILGETIEFEACSTSSVSWYGEVSIMDMYRFDQCNGGGSSPAHLRITYTFPTSSSDGAWSYELKASWDDGTTIHENYYPYLGPNPETCDLSGNCSGGEWECDVTQPGCTAGGGKGPGCLPDGTDCPSGTCDEYIWNTGTATISISVTDTGATPCNSCGCEGLAAMIAAEEECREEELSREDKLALIATALSGSECEQECDTLLFCLINLIPDLTWSEYFDLYDLSACGDDAPDVDSQTEDPSSYAREGPLTCDANSGVSAMPVDVTYGDKYETATDLVVPCTGPDLVLSRSYTSKLDYGGAGLVGSNWTMSPVFDFAKLNTSTSTIKGWCGTPPSTFGYRPFKNAGGSRWSDGGWSTQYMEDTTLTIGSNVLDVWRFVEPGQWERDFYQYDASGTPVLPLKFNGLLVQERDMYGNVRTYEYDNTTFSEPRLQRILLYSTSRSTTDPEAEIWFSWIGDSTSGNAGRLAGIQVVRNLGTVSAPEMVVTYQVEYRYKAESDGLSADVGTTGDLIEVKQRERIDRFDDDDPLWRERITLYRYHDESTASVSDERLNVTGGDHQLKAVIMPEQVEFMAQQMTWTGADPIAERIALAAESTLTKDDDDVAFTDSESTDIKVVDLAAKWIGYQTVGAISIVKDQYLQTSCGCGGSATQGTKLSYTLTTFTNDRTMKITQKTFSGSSYSASFRNEYYDTQMLTSSIDSSIKIPYVVTHAIEDAAATGNYWVWHWEYDSTYHRLIREMMPSAKSSYTVVSGSPASYTFSTSAGLVYGYAYDSNNRRTATYVRQGQDSSLTNFTKISQITYSTDTGHEYLPVTIERFRVAGSTSANDVETTTFAYGFHTGSTTALAWIKSSVERELESENGPSGTSTYDSYELFDAAGDNVWSRDASNSLTFRDFDDTVGTGSVLSVTRNSSSTGLNGSNFGGLTVTGWGTSSSGGSLTSTYTRDVLGRMTSRTEPGGATHYTRRFMAENSDRPDILYYQEVDLPHTFGSGTPRYDGPATVTFFNAAGASFARADYEVSASSVYDPGDVEFPAFTLSTQRSKALTIHRMSGLVEAQRAWPRIEDDPTAFDETTYEYDALGRVKYVTNPNGTVTGNTSYDVLNRVLEVQTGTDPTTSGNMKTVARYYYDHTGTDTSPAQGYGDGNLTLSFLHTGEIVSGSEVTRKTKRSYDFRNRLTKVLNPELPNEYLTYDNLDRVAERALFSADPSAINDPLASRGLYVTSSYSQRGLLYKQAVAIDPTASSPTYLESHNWYDEDGRVVADWKPNSPGVKRALDGLGRPSTISINDRLNDAAPGASGNYADAISLAKNYVLEQTVYRYNSAGLADLVTVKRRRDSLTSLAGLGSSDAVSTYTGYSYDGADRLIRTANFGTNDSSDRFITGTSAPTWPPSTPPNWDTSGYEDVIITATQYDVIGRVDQVTDPEGKKTRYVYDSLSRRVGVIENYDNASISWTSSSGGYYSVSNQGGGTLNDKDRVTTYKYDSVSNVTLQSAWQTGSVTSQTTQYLYSLTAGTGSGDSRLNSYDLLSEVRYPDETYGTPGTSNSYKVKYAYNVLGELRAATDQNETLHTYTRDNAGRVTTDIAMIASGSPIDDTIDQIAATFDSLGRLQYVRSYDGSTIKNAVEMSYTNLWQINRIYQDSDGDITRSGTSPTGNTVAVVYGYADAAVGSGNYSRLATLTYPTNASGGDDGRGVLYYNYGSGTVDSRISRLTSLKIPAPTGGNPSNKVELAAYTYLGADMIAGLDYPVPDVQLDRTVGSEGKRRLYGYTSQTTGLYPGYDRFGRVKVQEWVDGALTTHATDTDVPNIPPIVQLQYAYDNASNRLSKLDQRPGAAQQARDFEYVYDGLDRLIESKRGIAGTSFAQSSSTLNASQKWSLDMLGNWNSVFFDSNANGTYTSSSPDEEEVRTHNQANEIVSRVPDGASPPTLPFTYDAAGNLAEQARSSTATAVLSHDCWNRLIKVQTRVSSTTSPLAEYEYNGLHWRTVKRTDTTVPVDGALDEKREMYYSANWQLLEERIDTNYVSSSGVNAIGQQFWGTRYIDDTVAKRIDRNADGDFADSDDDAYFYLTDAQFSVVAVLDSGANLRERLSYDAYGHARHHWGADVDGDGDVDGSDAGTNNAQIDGSPSGYTVDADYNRDGVTNGSDVTDAKAFFGTSESALSPYGLLCGPCTGLVGTTTVNIPSTDNAVGYCGYVFNPETLLYTVRFRHYDPKQGRWLERDPLSYRPSLSLFEYIGGHPATFVDPYGLCACDPGGPSVPAGRSGPNSTFQWRAEYELFPENACIHVHVTPKGSQTATKYWWDPSSGKLYDGTGTAMSNNMFQKLSKDEELGCALRNALDKVKSQGRNKFVVKGRGIVTMSAVAMALVSQLCSSLEVAADTTNHFDELMRALQDGNEQMADKYAKELADEIMCAGLPIAGADFEEAWSEVMKPMFAEELKSAVAEDQACKGCENNGTESDPNESGQCHEPKDK